MKENQLTDQIRNTLRRYRRDILKMMFLFMVPLCFIICGEKTVIAATVNGGRYDQTQPKYSIATFNIRRTVETDTGNRAWSTRRPHVAKIIRKYDFDIFGIQEPMGPQIDEMVSDLTKYNRFGVSDHNDYAYQHQDIFYKKSKFILLTSGKFWLAPGGPDSPPADTRPWDNYYHSEVVTWGKFRDKSTGFEFYVFNAHFEPQAKVAQEESAKLMLSKVSSIADSSAVILMGDLNTDQRSNAYAILQNSDLLTDTYIIANTQYSNTATFNNWDLNPAGDSRLDHIFVTSHFQVNSYKVLTDNYHKILPSDHFPVLVELSKKHK